MYFAERKAISIENVEIIGRSYIFTHSISPLVSILAFVTQVFSRGVIVFLNMLTCVFLPFTHFFETFLRYYFMPFLTVFLHLNVRTVNIFCLKIQLHFSTFCYYI